MNTEKNTVAMVRVMLDMQDAFNQKVFPDWRERKLAWHRAIYVEAAEYLEHLGDWKWWKKGTPDLEQARMELVDIWHFAMSWYLDTLKSLSVEDVAKTLDGHVIYFMGLAARSNQEEVPVEQHHAYVDRLVARAGFRDFDMEAFAGLMCCCGMTFEDLYCGYIGKNVLNGLRQDKGYKTGTYVKVWDGREDNEHLAELLKALPLNADLPVRVREELEARYPA